MQRSDAGQPCRHLYVLFANPLTFGTMGDRDSEAAPNVAVTWALGMSEYSGGESGGGSAKEEKPQPFLSQPHSERNLF